LVHDHATPEIAMRTLCFSPLARFFIVGSMAAVAAGLLPRLALGQITKIEMHALHTDSPTDQEFLTGKKDTKPLTIVGELRLPRPGTERLPAVVVLHGSGGVTDREETWARELNALGVATFMIDSFTGRGIGNTITDQDQLSRQAMILDAYRALELLARHPRIDASRVMLMGFSRGGGAAHYAAIKRFVAMHGPSGGATFAGYIAFYPTCNRRFIDGVDVVDKPIRIFHGAADDYIPVAGCRAYVDTLKQAGKDAAIVEYAGVHHGFDNPARKSVVKVAQAQTSRNCPLLEEVPGGIIVNSRTRQPFTYATDPCVERGTTLAYDAAAYTDALKAVRELVTATLKPKPL
jgi:dienelactone hydrolase